MGATASQCCADCSENIHHEIVEASPSRRADNAVLPTESAVPLRRVPAPAVPREGGEARAVAEGSVASRSGLPAIPVTNPHPAAATAFGGASLCEAAAPEIAGAEGSSDAGSTGTSAASNASGAVSTATLTPRGSLRPHCAGAQLVVEAEAQESTEDLTEEPTLPPKEETLEVPTLATATAVDVAAPPPAVEGRSVKVVAPEGAAVEEERTEETCASPPKADAEHEQQVVEDGLTPRAETSVDPLQEAIADGSCQLQVEFETPQKEVIQEPPTPPTAVPESPAEPEQEAWADFRERARGRLKEAGISDDPSALFEVFQTTEDLGLTFASFARLYTLAAERVGDSDAATGQPPWASPAEAPGRSWRFPYQPIQRLLGSHWKAQKLWRLLSERTSRPEYAEAPCSRGRLEGRRCLVVGAGPCGLRAAIEMRLLGAQVTVAEQRTGFTRINQLHIWSWCGEDLKGLGAKCIEPPGSTFGSNPDLMHVTINELQKLLLKIALLLGVEVLLGVEYLGVKHIAGEWCAELRPASSNAAEGRAEARVCAKSMRESGGGGGGPSPRAPRHLSDIAVLIGAGGFSSTLGEQLGMSMTEMGGLRRESAIGLICNFARTHGKSEGQLRSYSMARQFYGPLFQQTAKETGVQLENIVYVKSCSSHYFVMTPTAKSLIACGVVKDPSLPNLLARGNLDSKKLDELVQRVAKVSFKQDEPPVLQAVLEDAGGRFPGYADEGPRLFDFSKMKRSHDGVKVVPPPGVDSMGIEDDSLLAVLVGDCLMEPFWPEGLGIIRGFFSVLDACSAVKLWAEGANGLKTAVHFDMAFTKLKTLSASTRARVLQENEHKYGLAPESRYRMFGQRGSAMR